MKTSIKEKELATEIATWLLSDYPSLTINQVERILNRALDLLKDASIGS